MPMMLDLVESSLRLMVRAGNVSAYGSKLLTEPERKYCVTRREMMADVTFVQQY